MKILYAGYSRTGATERALLMFRDKMGEQGRYIPIHTEKEKIGFAAAGFQSIRRKSAKIKLVSPAPNMAEYDLVVLGTPIWAGRISSPLRAFLRQNTGAKRVIVIATRQSAKDDGDRPFDEVDELTGVPRLADIAICVSKGNMESELEVLAARVKELL